MAIKVGVLGASGRMGSEVCKAIGNDPETTLVAAIDESGIGQQVTNSDLFITNDMSDVSDADVVVLSLIHI